MPSPLPRPGRRPLARAAYRLRRCGRIRAAAGLVASLVMGGAYLAGASQVAFGMHIGHVVQDGVDTGDLLALPLVIMALVSFGLALVCIDGLSRNRPSGYRPPSWRGPVRPLAPPSRPRSGSPGRVPVLQSSVRA